MNNSDSSVWLCSCGQKNTSNFCMKCGAKKRLDADISTSIGEIGNLSYDETSGNNASKSGSGSLNILVGGLMVIAMCCSVYIASENGVLDYFSSYNTKNNKLIDDKKIDFDSKNVTSNSELVDDKDVNGSESSKIKEYIEARNPDGANVHAESNAQKSLAQYYQNITDKNMSDAYALLSSAMQNHMGAYEVFSSEYNDTLSSIVKNMTTISSSDGYEEIEYYLEARDRINNNTKIKVSNFKGIAKMKLVDNAWVINELNVEQIGEHIE